MHPHRFDRLTQTLALRISRRSALAAGAGFGGLALFQAAPLRSVDAQDATPAVASDSGAATPSFLFVQSFDGGSIVPKEDAADTFVLTLHGEHGRTVGFTDRPDRIVGSTPTEMFLAGLDFGPENPPNAALVFEPTPGETDVIILELLAPRYDKPNQMLVYDVTILDTFESELGLGFQETPRLPDPAGEEFGLAQLFIDSADAQCGDISHCTNSDPNALFSNDFPGGPVDLCATSPVTCEICDGRTLQQLIQVCNETYPECNYNCLVN